MISVEHLGRTESIKLGKGARKTSYAIPRDSSGWFTFTARGQRALVFVRSPSDLAVAVEPAAPRYAPGATARLRVRTRVGQRPVKAAVGLFGVIAPAHGVHAGAVIRPAAGRVGDGFQFAVGQRRDQLGACLAGVEFGPQPLIGGVVFHRSSHTS